MYMYYHYCRMMMGFRFRTVSSRPQISKKISHAFVPTNIKQKHLVDGALTATKIAHQPRRASIERSW